MYEVVFQNDNGKVFTFGPSGSNWFGMSIGNGLEVNIGSSQGFAQIGETVERKSMSGRVIDVNGVFYGNIVGGKNKLRNICAPLSAGRLICGGKFFIDVHVKSAPTFSAVKNNGRFMMQFYAPFPFFSVLSESIFEIGTLVPKFRFPVNYATPHRFGTRSANRYVNVINPGDVRVPFRLVLMATGTSTNPRITNVETLETLQIRGTITTGQQITIRRDGRNVLRAELTASGQPTDIISWIDEASSLFELAPGDNLIVATDDESGASLEARITFHEGVAALYET